MSIKPNRPRFVVHTKSTGVDPLAGTERAAANAVKNVQSGPSATPMVPAPLAYRLHAARLRHDPARPDWPDRGRVLRSIGGTL